MKKYKVTIPTEIVAEFEINKNEYECNFYSIYSFKKEVLKVHPEYENMNFERKSFKPTDKTVVIQVLKPCGFNVQQIFEDFNW